MQRRHHGQHDSSCFACKAATVMLSPQATPTRRNAVRPQRTRYNRWEAGVAHEDRPGGFQMPIINSKGHEVGVKQYADYRGRFEQARRRVREQGEAALTSSKEQADA
ncbi:hypothetical protein ER308_07185 [Egibacter rhizosphaerae]|uniref:Uncharacterized protein n=1 Tax=Egibacter rhizosphaerae TaxID=1670831 RepID=A0A411YDN4_9ACTN|nr:hypothetical protein [Egibacter rhizosphaerae]QBI19349.1 hypothetical protein ER308_07185 [Egibacter rhizosphaerae]